MTNENLADIIEAAMDNVHDMDVTFRQYAEAAADAILAKLEPDAIAHPVRVKPLTWQDQTDKAGWVERYISGIKGERRYYSITRHNGVGERYWELENSFVSGPPTKYKTLEAAQAAAKADYEARILAAIEPAEAPDTDALIVAALEAERDHARARSSQCLSALQVEIRRAEAAEAKLAAVAALWSIGHAAGSETKAELMQYARTTLEQLKGTGQ